MTNIGCISAEYGIKGICENTLKLKSSFTCSNAAKSGNLEVLKWAHENGCAWNSSTCAKAAKEGHFEICGRQDLQFFSFIQFQ